MGRENIQLAAYKFVIVWGGIYKLGGGDIPKGPEKITARYGSVGF